MNLLVNLLLLHTLLLQLLQALLLVNWLLLILLLTLLNVLLLLLLLLHLLLHQLRVLLVEMRKSGLDPSRTEYFQQQRASWLQLPFAHLLLELFKRHQALQQLDSGHLLPLSMVCKTWSSSWQPNQWVPEHHGSLSRTKKKVTLITVHLNAWYQDMLTLFLIQSDNGAA